MQVSELLAKGANHIAGQQYLEAQNCFRAAYDAEPKNVDAANGLGIALHELGRLDEAIHFLSIAVRLAPGFPLARINLGLVYLERNDLDDALACFREVLRLRPADPETLANTFGWMATCLERKDELPRVEEYFVKAARLSNTFKATKMLRFSKAFLREIDALKAPDLPTTEILKSDSDVPVTLVTLVTSDPKYFRKYGQAMINSFAHFNNADNLLHLHIMDPDETIATEAHALLTRAAVKSYRVTSELTTFFAPGTLEKLVWYTCSRLWHLGEYVSDYNTPVIALDIDAAIQTPLTKIVDAVGAADLGLYFRQPRRSPWLDIVACVVVARPTQATHTYLRLLRNYISYFIQRGSAQWHLDQSALYCTLRMLQQHSKAPAVHSVAEIGAEASFHVGHSYDHRMKDPCYARFSS